MLLLTTLFTLFAILGLPLSEGSKPIKPKKNKKKNKSFGLCEREDVDVLIVGAGFAGIAAGLRLEEFNGGLSYKIVEADETVGGRGVAAFFLSGENNPLLNILEDSSQGSHGQYVIPADFESTLHYGVNGEYTLEVVESVKEQIKHKLLCAQGRYLQFAFGEINDESIREALEVCGWHKPQPGSLEESLEWYFIDFDLAAPPEKTGLYNFPFVAPVEDVGPGNFYLKTPRNAAFIAEILAEPLINSDKIVTGMAVDLIDWRRNNVRVFAAPTDENDDSCIEYRAKRVVVTTSIGVLDRRGDNNYGPLSDPMYVPTLPKRKMKAIRDLYIDGTRSPTGMGEYRTFRFQFDEAFWDKNAEYFTIDNSQGRGRFSTFQNLDYDGFYPDSKALKSFLTTDQYDQILDEGGFDNDKVNELLRESLGQAFPGFFDANGMPYECHFATSFEFPDPNLNLGEHECVWSFFGGENELWYGSYTAWKPVLGKSRKADRLFERAFFPLEPQRKKGLSNFVLWFTGAAYCDFHSEFVHGAYWSGILTINEILDDYGLLSEPVENTFEYKVCFQE